MGSLRQGLMAKHHQNQIIFAWGNLAVLGSEVGSWSCSGRREAHLDEGVCRGGRGLPHPPCSLQEGCLRLFSSRASQVTFRLQPKGSQGQAGWRAWAGPWLLLPLCLPAGFTHRLQLPLLRSLTQATSGPPLSHCLPREAPGGN